MISHTKPKSFDPKFEVVSCFFEHNGKILLLHREKHKQEPNTWGVPAGKRNSDENLIDAIYREIYEETCNKINNVSLNYFDKLFVTYPTYQFIYHIFSYANKSIPNVQINRGEHQDYTWANPTDALKLNLIPDLDYCIKYFYKV